MGIKQKFGKYDVRTTRKIGLLVTLTYRGQNHSEMLTFSLSRIGVLVGAYIEQKLHQPFLSSAQL